MIDKYPPIMRRPQPDMTYTDEQRLVDGHYGIWNCDAQHTEHIVRAHIGKPVMWIRQGNMPGREPFVEIIHDRNASTMFVAMEEEETTIDVIGASHVIGDKYLGVNAAMYYHVSSDSISTQAHSVYYEVELLTLKGSCSIRFKRMNQYFQPMPPEVHVSGQQP